jgi:hypothetical protein
MENIKQHIANLEQEKAAKNAQIVALVAQLHTAPPPYNDEDSDDNGNNDGDDGAANVGGKE